MKIHFLSFIWGSIEKFLLLKKLFSLIENKNFRSPDSRKCIIKNYSFTNLSSLDLIIYGLINRSFGLSWERIVSPNDENGWLVSPYIDENSREGFHDDYKKVSDLARSFAHILFCNHWPWKRLLAGSAITLSASADSSHRDIACGRR